MGCSPRIFTANDVLENAIIGVNSGIDESRFSAPREFQDEDSRLRWRPVVQIIVYRVSRRKESRYIEKKRKKQREREREREE